MSIRSEDTIGYWLFYTQRCVEYAFSAALRLCCEEYGKPYAITPSQWGTLSLLHEHDGLTIGTIALRRASDAPTITGIVKRLEQNGLVERHHDLEDRRVVKVYLTVEGQDIMSVLPSAAEAFNSTMIRGLSESEQQEFLTNLQRVIANVSSIALGTGERFSLPLEHLHWEQEELERGSDTSSMHEKERY